jgi:hypothetical protein
MKLIIQLLKLIREEYILLTAFGPVQRKWLRFLKAHPEIQERRTLGIKKDDNTYTACCLGQFGLMTGICKWEGDRLHSLQGSINFPDYSDMLNYGFYTGKGKNNSSSLSSLAFINDTATWLDVYNACINDPKGYFSKKV